MSTPPKPEQPPRELRVCRAIRLLAQDTPAAEAAREVRVLPRTLAAWQADEDFQALLACVQRAGRVRDVLAMLNELLPDAIAALQRALDGDDDRIAVDAAREVLRYMGHIKRLSDQTIRVEYVNPDDQPYSTAPWADRHPASPGALQGGGVRSPLRQDGDGQNPDD